MAIYWPRTVYNFNCLVMFKKSCSLRIWRMRITAKKKGKLSTSQLIMVQHDKIEDPFFLYQMGWVNPKKNFSPLSLSSSGFLLFFFNSSFLSLLIITDVLFRNIFYVTLYTVLHFLFPFFFSEISSEYFTFHLRHMFDPFRRMLF